MAAWQENSTHAKSWALRLIEREMPVGQARARLAVWGLAYKQDTHSIKNSAAIELVQGPAPDGTSTLTIRRPSSTPPRHPNLTLHSTALAALAHADAARGDDTLARSLRPRPRKRSGAALDGILVIDPYGILDHAACTGAGLRHFRIGSA